MADLDVSGIARLIQLAVAPVFLLSGVGAILAVLASRLSRIIDRARILEVRLETAEGETKTATNAELATLARRARLVGRAITLCATTALLVCAVIVTLFSSAFLDFDAATPVALLFIAAMLAFFFGLLWFLREIFLATASVRIGPRL